MPSIVSYRKITDAYATYSLRVPDGATELATIDDVTYVSLPDGATLPADQPAEITFTPGVSLDAALMAAITAVSPHADLILRRRAMRIAGGEAVAAANAWAAAQMAAIGLLPHSFYGPLANAKTLRIARINAECKTRITDRWPLEKQLSAIAGIYGAIELEAMTLWVDAHVAASNAASDAVDAAANQSQMEAVTVAWPT